MKNRLFVALNLPDEALSYLVQLRDDLAQGNNVNWEANDKLHLTLKFIGEVETELIEDISQTLQFLNECSRIYLQFSNFGFFYRDGKPSILWTGLKDNLFLTEMVNKINHTLKKFNIPIENKQFKPHITLLRIKKDLDISFVKKFKNFTFEPKDFYAETLTLYKSILYKQGSKYFKIKNYKLK